VSAAVEELPRDVPPANPSIGAAYLVGGTPQAEWAGHGLAIAGWTAGGWRFVTPLEGLSAYVRSAQLFAIFRAGAWEIGAVRAERFIVSGQQVIGARAGAVADPAGGTTIDGEARASVSAILDALRGHGLIDS